MHPGRHATVAVILCFGALSLIPVIALGFGLERALTANALQAALADARDSAQLLALSVVGPIVIADDFSSPLSASRLAELDARVGSIAGSNFVTRLKIWSPQGAVVYSDNASLIGHRFPIDDNLGQALGGSTVSGLSNLSAPENSADTLKGQLLEVYTPLHVAGQPTSAGVLELYVPWAPVLADTAQQSHHIDLILLSGLALLYAAMLPVFLVADRWRRRMTASLVIAREEHERAEETIRLSDVKSKFLAAMSHELRTPLNSVLGFVQLLRMPGFGELNEKQGRYAANIDKAGRHLLSLIDDVLDLSKIEAGRMDLELADFRLGPLLDQTVEILQPLADAKSLSLTIAVARELAVHADRLRLTQVVVNLLSNAIKFTQPEGSVRVTARRAGPDIELTVTDNGSGIPIDEQAAVFEEFTQGDPSRTRRHDGTGLGLPLSRRLIELMGGRLELVESLPTGSSFRIRIPGAAAAAAAALTPALPRAR